MITCYIITYNEEVMLPFTIQFYRSRFPGCVIVIYDNHSNDMTLSIALDKGCRVLTYDTQGELRDNAYRIIKNTCYEHAETDWVLVADCDELLDINQTELSHEIDRGVTIIRSQGWNMVNQGDEINLDNIKHGVRDKQYDKYLLFDSSRVIINYGIGAHQTKPTGPLKYSLKKYKLLHYKYINPDYLVKRYKEYATRLSKENLENNWGGQFLDSEQSIRDRFIIMRSKSQKII